MVRLPEARYYRVGPIEIDLDHYFARVDGVDVVLSPIEMKLLADLVTSYGRVRLRTDLLRDVWGYRAGVNSRTTDTYVLRLRRKLGTAGTLLETVRGVGYRLNAQEPRRLE
jgi:two-component system phosphate regulon response regulator PhoB